MTTAKKDKYFEGIGRRKTSQARVRITEAGKTSYSVNEKKLSEHFSLESNVVVVKEVFEKAGISKKFSVSAKVSGGGKSSQAESIRLGIARALVLFDSELRPVLKKEGFLKRDPRSVERKKFGLKKARKRAQWSKR